MSNDPDLLDEECRDCQGTGWIYDEHYDAECCTCCGEGQVLRG